MKNSTFLAGLICWRACWPFLTEISRRCPPTHCQILFYYGAFKSYIGQHRDNSNVQYIKNVVREKQQTRIGHSSGGVENSQILGSNVLVLTFGNKPMCFKFKYPTVGYLTAARSTYETSAKHVPKNFFLKFCISLQAVLNVFENFRSLQTIRNVSLTRK
jgi:hypothetical protein